jgi:hypothetical protein
MRKVSYATRSKAARGMRRHADAGGGLLSSLEVLGSEDGRDVPADVVFALRSLAVASS